jgi:hypothetical protein
MSDKEEPNLKLHFSESFVSDDTGLRGEIYNEDAFKQPMLFSGMTYERNISPSDWDFFLEFNGNLFFYGEGKKAPKDLTTGQRRSIEHTCNSHDKSSHIAIGFFFQHEVPAPKPVYVKDQSVTKYYWKGYWHYTNPKPTVAEFIDKVISWCKKKGIEL